MRRAVLGAVHGSEQREMAMAACGQVRSAHPRLSDWKGARAVAPAESACKGPSRVRYVH
jgi:hypothetical protein